MKIYAGHSRSIFDTVEEQAFLKRINEKYPGCEIINPKNVVIAKEDKSFHIIMEKYFNPLIDASDLVIVRKDEKGKYTSGIRGIIKYAQLKGKKIEDIDNGLIKVDTTKLDINSQKDSKYTEYKKADYDRWANTNYTKEWALYDRNGELLKERTWDGGSQLTISNQIIDYFKKMNADDKPKKTNILILKSVPGTGKSPIALHVAKQMGRTIIVVPNKYLQAQYFRDYGNDLENGKFILKDNGEKLNIKMIMGRSNFECIYLKDKDQKGSCSHKNLPCNRKLEIGEMRYMAACECTHYIPRPMLKSRADIMSKSMYRNYKNQYIVGADDPEHDENINLFEKMKEQTKTITKKYISRHGETLVFFRKDDTEIPVCQYYKQFYSYIDADVIIMNTSMWRVETDWMYSGKPMVDLEVLDEGDFFLDKLDNVINIKRKDIEYIKGTVSDKIKKIKSDALNLFDSIYSDLSTNSKDSIIKLNDNPKYVGYVEYLYSLFTEYIRYKWDDMYYHNIAFELKRILNNKDKAIISINQKDKKDKPSIDIAIIYQDELLHKLFQLSSNNIIMMSGTLHMKEVAEKLFGLTESKYNILYLDGRKDHIAEPIIPYYISICLQVNHQNWQDEDFKLKYKERMNLAIDKMLKHLNEGFKVKDKTYKSENGKILIPTIGKKYVKFLEDRNDVYLDIRKEKLDDKDDNNDDYNILDIDAVLKTDKRIIVSTSMNRGADLKGDLCRGIIIPKSPYPDLSSLDWQGLKAQYGNFFWNIAEDKARREIEQSVFRGLRDENDWVVVISLDSNVIKFLIPKDVLYKG